VPCVSADRAAVATQSRCRDGQEPALVRRISASAAALAGWIGADSAGISSFYSDSLQLNYLVKYIDIIVVICYTSAVEQESPTFCLAG